MFLNNNYHHLSSQHLFLLSALLCNNRVTCKYEFNSTLTYIQITKINNFETFSRNKTNHKIKTVLLKTPTSTYVSKFITSDDSAIEITHFVHKLYKYF